MGLGVFDQTFFSWNEHNSIFSCFFRGLCVGLICSHCIWPTLWIVLYNLSARYLISFDPSLSLALQKCLIFFSLKSNEVQTSQSFQYKCLLHFPFFSVFYAFVCVFRGGKNACLHKNDWEFSAISCLKCDHNSGLVFHAFSLFFFSLPDLFENVSSWMSVQKKKIFSPKISLG